MKNPEVCVWKKIYRKEKPVLSTDREEFEKLMKTLCAAFNTPPTPVRIDSYWRAFHRQTLAEFAHLVDVALDEEAELTAMPTVPELRALRHRQRRTTFVQPAQPQDERDHLQFFGNRMLLKLMLLSGGLGSTAKFVPGTGMVGAQASPLLTELREQLKLIVEWFREGVLVEDESATPKYFVELVERAFAKSVPITLAVKAEWAKFCEDPAGSKPFPAYMARNLDPKPQQQLLPAA